jgi:succinyl-CoA synthetase alpha subunit
VVSRSGTLTYEVVGQLTARGIGQSELRGASAAIRSTAPRSSDVLKLFNEDPARARS